MDEHSRTSFKGDSPAAAQDAHMVDRRELALVAVERTRMPMVVSDPNQADNPIILANQAFLDLTGYSADEVIGRNCRFLQGRDTATADVDLMRDQLNHDADQIELELLNYRKDGTTFWNQLDISAVRDGSGRLLYHFASQKDVTARRQAQALEANEHRLLMEVDHRAMNALALVQSVIGLTRADTVEGKLQAIRRRVNSIALSHRLLAEQHWRSVGLHAVIRSQITDKHRHRVRLQGNIVELAPHMVQPLGLVLHELFSNAEIHGAFADNAGEIDISWASSDGTLGLTWVETPSRMTNAHSVNAVGLDIVRLVVENQLNGQIFVDNSDSQLVIEIHLTDALANWVNGSCCEEIRLDDDGPHW